MFIVCFPRSLSAYCGRRLCSGWSYHHDITHACVCVCVQASVWTIEGCCPAGSLSFDPTSALQYHESCNSISISCLQMTRSRLQSTSGRSFASKRGEVITRYFVSFRNFQGFERWGGLLPWRSKAPALHLHSSTSFHPSPTIAVENEIGLTWFDFTFNLQIELSGTHWRIHHDIMSVYICILNSILNSVPWEMGHEDLRQDGYADAGTCVRQHEKRWTRDAVVHQWGIVGHHPPCAVEDSQSEAES